MQTYEELPAIFSVKRFLQTNLLTFSINKVIQNCKKIPGALSYARAFFDNHMPSSDISHRQLITGNSNCIVIHFSHSSVTLITPNNVIRRRGMFFIFTNHKRVRSRQETLKHLKTQVNVLFFESV